MDATNVTAASSNKTMFPSRSMPALASVNEVKNTSSAMPC